MTLSLSQPLALITGASSGIGKTIAHHFARNQFTVLGATRSGIYHFSYDDHNQVHESLEIDITFDLSNVKSVKDTIDYIKDRYGRIDCLVNSAGIAHGSLIQMTRLEDLQRCMNINFIGQICVIQESIRLLRKSEAPCIINISSISAFRSDPGSIAYGASKAALNFATSVLSSELQQFNIRVNAIAPGVTNTPMLDQMSESSIRKQTDAADIKIVATPLQIAEVALFLSTKSSSHITGQIIKVDGGQLCR